MQNDNLKFKIIFSLIILFEIFGLAKNSLAAAPTGYLELAGGFTISGWAKDDDYSGPISVHVYVDGILRQIVLANLFRQDLTDAGIGNHAFQWNHSGFGAGEHFVNVYAIGVNSQGQLDNQNVDLIGSPKNLSLGDAFISAQFDGSPIVIKITNRLAGAIDSLNWKGKEFVDSVDHGRQIQLSLTANNLGECYNPTEAGSRADGNGPVSTSVLMSISGTTDSLETKTKGAFWLTPGEQSDCYFKPETHFPANPWGTGNAVNSSNLSDFIFDKKIKIGYQGMSNVIEYSSKITIPGNIGFPLNYFILTNPAVYMPIDFSRAYRFDPRTKNLTEMPGNFYGYTAIPAILATADNQYALAVYSPEIPWEGFPGNEQKEYVGYSAINWASFGNTMYIGPRIPKMPVNIDSATFQPGTYSYKSYIIIGKLSDVQNSVTALYQMEPPAGDTTPPAAPSGLKVQ
jgi:hypothetical protein